MVPEMYEVKFRQAEPYIRGIRVLEFSNEIKNGYANFKTFPGADSRQILQYVNPSVESGNYDSAVPHFGVNEVIQKTRINSDTVENLIENIRKAGVKLCRMEYPKLLCRRLYEIKVFINRFKKKLIKICYLCVRGLTIITFALRGEGMFHQNANVCEQGEQGSYQCERSHIIFF